MKFFSASTGLTVYVSKIQSRTNLTLEATYHFQMHSFFKGTIQEVPTVQFQFFTNDSIYDQYSKKNFYYYIFTTMYLKKKYNIMSLLMANLLLACSLVSNLVCTILLNILGKTYEQSSYLW